MHHHNFESETLALLKHIHKHLIEQGEILMALSAKMQEFVDASSAAFTAASDSLNNISADVQRLLSTTGSGLSDEDKAALDSVITQLNTLKDNLAAAAAVVPE